MQSVDLLIGLPIAFLCLVIFILIFQVQKTLVFGRKKLLFEKVSEILLPGSDVFVAHISKVQAIGILIEFKTRSSLHLFGEIVIKSPDGHLLTSLELPKLSPPAKGYSGVRSKLLTMDTLGLEQICIETTLNWTFEKRTDFWAKQIPADRKFVVAYQIRQMK